MKKSLFLIAFACATLFSVKFYAQDYQGEVDFGYSLGVGKLPSDRFNVSTVHGLEIEDYLFLGVGAGLDYHFVEENIYADFGDDDHYYGGYFEKDRMGFLPVFFNIKGYLPLDDDFMPFLSLDLGYSFCLSDDGESGLYVTPSVGIRLFEDFKIQVGYNLQQMTERGVSLNIGAVQFKVGYLF